MPNKKYYDRSGFMGTGELTIGILNGFNKFVVQGATDAMTGPGVGSAGRFPQTSEWYKGNKLWRVADHGAISITDRIDLMYVVAWTEMEYDKIWQVNTDLGLNLPAKRTWITAGIRPIWKWSELMSTALEIGYDKVEHSLSEYTDTSTTPNNVYGSIFDSELWKFTIAQQFHPKFGAWVRPQIRVFATYADWKTPGEVKKYNGTAISSAQCNAGDKAQCSALGLDGNKQQVIDSFGTDSEGWTFGAQMEVWW